MNMRHPTNDAIAAAARSLVEADPSPALRARVIARLDEAPRPPWRWWLLVPAAASLVVAAAIAGRPLTTLRLPDRAPATSLFERRALLAPVIDRSRLAWNAVTAAAQAPSQRAVAASKISAAEAAWFSAALQPIATPDIAVPAVTQPPPVAVALLEIEALVAPPMAVRPLDADRDRRVP